MLISSEDALCALYLTDTLGAVCIHIMCFYPTALTLFLLLMQVYVHNDKKFGNGKIQVSLVWGILLGCYKCQVLGAVVCWLNSRRPSSIMSLQTRECLSTSHFSFCFISLCRHLFLSVICYYFHLLRAGGVITILSSLQTLLC